jgi:hypothetical protein
MNIPMTLTYLRPNEQWALDGDTYAGLTWLDSTEKPTEGELAEAWPLAEKAAQDKAAADAAATTAAIAHAKSLGFTDAMIAVMYPNLGVNNE